jgi:alkyl hydroperoxide reductase subunit AhpC
MGAESVFIVVVVSLVAIFVLMFAALGRNDAVLAESLRVLDAIQSLNRQDIEQGKPCEWRYAEFRKVSYERMLLEFWKPVSSFYRNHPCLQESQE